MFEVYFSRDVRRENFDKATAEKFQVLDVLVNDRGTFFLIYHRGNWRWHNANEFVQANF